MFAYNFYVIIVIQVYSKLNSCDNRKNGNKEDEATAAVAAYAFKVHII